MVTLPIIISLLLAYIMGSIPTAVWVGKAFYGIDVREYGSGNAGATNTFRVLGKKAGIPVLLVDSLKGFGAVSLIHLFAEEPISTDAYVNYQLALGIAAVIGHIFPVFAGFRGGKGIATLLGIMLAIHTEGALLAMSIFIIVFAITKFVSLGSMVAAISFPFIIVLVFQSTVPSLIVFSMFIAILVLITHQKNIERLVRREESKANISIKNLIKQAGEDD
ncbi:MAG: glycerol-3-phosphate 1-O-acyltransferase PlsY [Salibacteraceae bacterium]|jgi:acyl phosphate:glycerol-3-phosphate acyltransferase|nr:glycerol-3-phosphate 1-O-acyltransferase PlsY [Salibacteraceae bacterium]MDP4686883.1 glycerol-3-phosphate 1-O-acyltransferase PlsY [Salibacteraceae bacterium]MDP4763153.1 glycerol-3-phosphate 1-O-acyltransferase PlsY [Salibacteraceae bacterium]MDP4844811.1 glycerol-3-phosphate 1-O-acyltransferase PlsY [Salibacteraceae bacterium]MDP4933417.1 glycerol-3-phosphate 1-O-acyltransferase PlsY [Salibacteraceae bacterium]